MRTRRKKNAGHGEREPPMHADARRLNHDKNGRRRIGVHRRASAVDCAVDDLGRRIERVRRGLYGLYDDLCYFKTCPPAHRERLRRELDWPDVGHITSLARALAEEERFSEWVRFNRLTKSA